MKNPIIRLLIIGLVAALALGFAKDVIAQSAVQGIVKAVTGLGLEVRRLHLGILTTLVDIRGLRLMNPSGFKDRVMMDVPEIHVNYELASFFKGAVHIQEMDLDLKEFTVVKNAKGDVNVNHLKPASKKEAAPAQEARPQAAKPAANGAAPNIRIDRLHLKIGKVIYKDYSQGGAPQIQEFPVNLDETDENITNPSALVGIITAKALMNTTVARLANIDMKGLMSNFDFQGMNMNNLGLPQFEDLVNQVGQKGIKEKAAEALGRVSNFFSK